jgi:hypothetical protein
MLELDAHNWVTLGSETRTVQIKDSMTRNLPYCSSPYTHPLDCGFLGVKVMIFRIVVLVLRKQAEFNIIQKKAKVKKKFDGYDEALNRSFKMKISCEHLIPTWHLELTQTSRSPSLRQSY